MTTLVALAAGFVAGSVLLLMLRPTLAQPALDRVNHRGAHLPTAGGLVPLAAILAVEGIWALVDGTGVHRNYVLVFVVFGALGFVDDVLGSGTDGRGFGGHLRALRHGRLTTGGLKLLAGGAAALIACTAVDGDRIGRLVLDALLVALSANLANLLDRAPGRTLKVGALCAIGLGAAGALDHRLAGVAVAVGASLALLPADLGERLMLGDTGANPFGAVLALGVVLVAPFGVRVVVFLVVLALNVASEAVSFSAAIEAVPPLRWVDRAGRRPRYPEVP